MSLTSKFVMFAALVAGGTAVYAVLTDPGEDGHKHHAPAAEAAGPVIPAALTEAAKRGQRAFNQTCADCHGQDALGGDGGPPLIHKIYEPSHHADITFYRAVEYGVKGHHWRFGDMPAQSGVPVADVDAIIAFVREVQEANGIF